MALAYAFHSLATIFRNRYDIGISVVQRLRNRKCKVLPSMRPVVDVNGERFIRKLSRLKQIESTATFFVREEFAATLQEAPLRIFVAWRNAASWTALVDYIGDLARDRTKVLRASHCNDS